MYNILEITDSKFDDACWQEYYALLEQLYLKYKSRFTKTSWEIKKEQFLSYTKANEHFHPFVVFNKTQTIGWMDFNVFNCGTKEQQVFLAIDALFDEIPNGLSMLLASQIIRLSNSYKLNQIFLMTSDQRISNLARAWKCKELNRIDHFQLHRIKADNALIDEWLATIPANNQELHLEFYDYVPEKYLSQYAKLFSQFVNEMPKEKEFDKEFHLSEEKIVNEEKWDSENNWFKYGYYLLDSKNSIIGLSKAIIDGNNPYDVYQGMTGIVKEYRGRGLSKWLKAALYKKIGEDFPENEILTTDMRAVNKPIQRVNKQMGFELIKQGNEFDIRLADLEGFLKANK